MRLDGAPSALTGALGRTPASGWWLPDLLDRDVSTRTAAVGRTCGDSPRRKRSMMSRRPPQQGQAGVDVSSLVTGSGSEPLGDGGASRLRIRAILAVLVPLAKRP